MLKVIIYSTPECKYCQRAKAFFQEHSIPYEEKDVSSSEEFLDEAVFKSNQMGVPVIEINDQIIVGFNQERVVSLLGIVL